MKEYEREIMETERIREKRKEKAEKLEKGLELTRWPS